MGRKLIWLIIALSFIYLVSAANLDWIYNPFTSRQDATLDTNQTGFNLTADLFCDNGGDNCYNLTVLNSSLTDTNETERVDALELANVSTNLRITDLNQSFNNTSLLKDDDNYLSVNFSWLDSLFYTIVQIEVFNTSLHSIFYNQTEIELMNTTLTNEDSRINTELINLESNFTDQNATNYLEFVEVGDSAGGDLGGTYPNPTVNDNSHLLDWANISNKFIEAVDNDYLYMVSTTATFNETKNNETIDNKIASVTYNASSINTTEGTLDAGNLASIQAIDTDWYNVSEVGGGNPLLVEINFTGVNTFNNILLREQYLGGLGHEIKIQTWNYDSSVWETHSQDITDQSSMVEYVLDILDSGDHISGGLVQLRLDHQGNGNSGHDLFIDYIALQKGFTSITNADHDSLLGRDDSDNHPWALPRDGSKALTSDWNAGQFNITAIFNFQVNATYFTWNGSFFEWNFGDIYTQTQIEGMNDTLTAADTLLNAKADDLNTTKLDKTASFVGDVTGTYDANVVNQDFNQTGGLGNCSASGACATVYQGTNQVLDTTSTIAASKVTTGTFGTGSYVIDENLTIEGILTENGGNMTSNSSCGFIFESNTATFAIC